MDQKRRICYSTTRFERLALARFEICLSPYCYRLFSKNQYLSLSQPSSWHTLRTPEPLSSHRPIILDESYASPESAAFHEAGYEGALVARVDSPNDLLSMSAYGKPANTQSHGYNTGRTYTEGPFPYASPVYEAQSLSVPASTAPGFQSTTQLTPMAYPANSVHAHTHAHVPYDDQSGPYLNVGSTPVPEVKSFSPHSGSEDTKIYVSITSLYELMTSSTPEFFLMFGHRKCQASLAKASQQGGVCQYTVTTEVPHFSATNWGSAQVPIDMFMESGDGDVMGKVAVGKFTYLSGSTQGGSETPQDLSRKRKISSESAELQSPIKRASIQVLRPKEEFSTYGYSAADGGSYAPYLQPSASYGNLLPQYNRSVGGYQTQPSTRHLAYSYSNSATASPPTMKAQSPQVGSWSPAYGAVSSNMVRSPGIPSSGGVTRPSLSALPSPAASANPRLIRTSTLQQTPIPASTPHAAHPGQQFNAYALYPHKAKLEINGDLDAMAQSWSEEEWDLKRRLVHFRRSQAGSTITTTFQPVSVDERPQDSVCISCIYWEEKQDCFVTSVDTIYLLERLVAVQFTVEEKNRIRRNLEGFHPVTVSKGKSDSEEFFKVIMAFPTPKPRNIEKDVKVFHWKDLASALKKIFGKYSAGPASTLPPAPALLTPVSSTGYATEGSSAGLSYASDHHGAISPRSITGSTSSTAYAGNMPTRVLSPHSQKSMALQGGPPDLRVSLPQNPHETPGHWPGGHHHMQASQQQYQQHLGSQSGRASWDISSVGVAYLDNGPATTAGSSAGSQSLNYSRSVNVGEQTSDNRIARSLSVQQQSHQMPRT
ncbi:hypothetical protein LHYA1_G000714 [Lachnellula hyalina]|uniref:DUF7082 domain-containing protein n=1 Tax=Lachnellula hyalina TaxID=1316788 RepID=A0A8H8R9W3_9HELO|nr:uncharacterized protein LHYA1_G000714 [Lachnellula hyalina]TVY30227.1 hypothetical protein LHYA1_G000714 [Lachnellula hyalina]